MKIKHFELVNEAKQFLKENYDMDLEIPIVFNTRTKKMLGRFIYTNSFGESIPKRIEMSVNAMLHHPREHIIDILKHELVHYALCAKKKPFSDGDYYFENELKRLGVNSTHTYEGLGEFHRYECINCGHMYHRRSRLGENSFCKCSAAPNLEYKGIYTKTHAN